MSKKRIKERIRPIRDAQCDKMLWMKSGSIEGRLFSLPEFQSAKTVLFYVSIMGEVRTSAMIERALAQGKRVIVPKVMPKKRLELYEISDKSEFEEGKFGILEPRKGCCVVSLDEVDVTIVPGVAFDEKGNRIGYSAGYYDRLLREFKGLKIALASELQVVEEVPSQSHDVAVDTIITEKRIINCERG